MTGATPTLSPNQPMRVPRCSLEYIDKIATCVRLEISAFAAACPTRATITSAKLGLNAQQSEHNTKIMSATT